MIREEQEKFLALPEGTRNKIVPYLMSAEHYMFGHIVNDAVGEAHDEESGRISCT